MTKSGICTHSTNAAFEDYAIFSTAAHRQQALRDYLAKTDDPHGLGSRELIGSYKGEIEPAWLVNVKRLETLIKKGFLIEQESILILDHNPRGARKASLLFLRGDVDAKQDLGLFVPANEDEARACEGWSFDPVTSTYWICTKGD